MGKPMHFVMIRMPRILVRDHHWISKKPFLYIPYNPGMILLQLLSVVGEVIILSPIVHDRMIDQDTFVPSADNPV